MTSLSVIKKTTNSYTLTFTNDGAVQDITGWTVFFTVKKSINQTDAEAAISKTITSHTNPTAGITTITLSATDTDISAGAYVYDIAFIDSSANRRAIAADNFLILGNVTQRNS